MKFSVAQNEKECAEAIALATTIFREASNKPNYSNIKSHMWHRDPSFSLHNIILAKDSNDSIVGLVRIVPRKIYNRDRIYKVAGFSSVCVDKSARGRGLATNLINYAIDISNKRSFDFAILFSRRAVDYFYTQFDFWGASSYNHIEIRRPSELTKNKNCRFIEKNLSDIDLYNKAYCESYEDVFGRIERCSQSWQNKLRHIPNIGLTFKAIEYNNELVGYCLYDTNVILEIGLTNPSKYNLVIAALFELLDTKVLDLSVSINHACFPYLKCFELKVSYRKCWWGGHMVRLLNNLHNSTGLLGYDKTLENLGIFIGAQPTENQSVRHPFNICFLDEL
jgi:predicted GNAT family N-acyltransferase